MTAAVPAEPNLATSHAMDALTIVAGVWKMFAMLTSTLLQFNQLWTDSILEKHHEACTYVLRPEEKNELVLVKDTGSSLRLPVLLDTPKSVVGKTSSRTMRMPKVDW